MIARASTPATGTVPQRRRADAPAPGASPDPARHPFLYNGEEIGMSDLVITDPAPLRDTMATWYYDSPGGRIETRSVPGCRRAGAMSRDKNRTPMQWRRPQRRLLPAGVEPWLPVNPDYAAGSMSRTSGGFRLPAQLSTAASSGRARHSPRWWRANTGRCTRPRATISPSCAATEAQTVLVLLNYSDARRDLRFDVPGKQTAHVRFSSRNERRGPEPGPHQPGRVRGVDRGAGLSGGWPRLPARPPCG